MAAINLTKLFPEELTQLERDIKAERKRRLDAERKVILDQARTLAKKHGVSIDALLQPNQQQRRSAPAKYRNPKNQKQTWSGGGKKPQWVQQHHDAGGALTNLEAK
jgi:DNA-binding protein H-NS